MAINDRGYSATVDADGTAVVTIRAEDGINTWVVSQVSAELPSAPLGATCEIRKNGSLVSPLIPTGDAADSDPPVHVRPGDSLTVSWAGCTPETVANVFIIYDDGRPA